MYADPRDPRALEKRRQHYRANKQVYQDRTRAVEHELAEHVRSLKDAPCLDCNVRYPYYVMQFDHVRGEKVGDIARMVKRGSRAKLVEELAKCELVCANCHAERTWQRSQTVV